MNFNWSPDEIYNALFGNLLGFILLIIVIIIFVGILIYREVNPRPK